VRKAKSQNIFFYFTSIAIRNAKGLAAEMDVSLSFAYLICFLRVFLALVVFFMFLLAFGDYYKQQGIDLGDKRSSSAFPVHMIFFIMSYIISLFCLAGLVLFLKRFWKSMDTYKDETNGS